MIFNDKAGGVQGLDRPKTVHLVDLVTTAAATAEDLVTWTKGKSQPRWMFKTFTFADSHFPVTSVSNIEL